MFGNELTSMIDDGAGLVVGTVGDDGEPRATRAWSVSVGDPAECRVRVGAGVALNGADVRTFRSVQLKGRIVAVEAPDPTDLEVTRVQSDLFLRTVHETDGNPLESLRRILPLDVVAVEIVVEEMYDQTPGPDAGRPLAAP